MSEKSAYNIQENALPWEGKFLGPVFRIYPMWIAVGEGKGLW